MHLRYMPPDGDQSEFKLGASAVTIGRSVNADISIPDKLASRIHCGISFSDNSYFIRDFKSRNGTYLNNRRIDVARLRIGDKILVGNTVITVESDRPKGTETVLKEVKDEMDKGKGYKTMLIEITRKDKKKR